MKRIYMYPKNDYETLESPNPYVQHVEAVLQEKHRIINERPNSIGVMEFFLYLFRADIFFFNWIEDVSVKRFGKIQAVLLPVFLFFARISGKKIIWVLHNLYSHEESNRAWTRYAFDLMIRRSDLILTHSQEGLRFLDEKFPAYRAKAIYLVHPVEEMMKRESAGEKSYDLFIWGTIHPYKGVIEFLEFITRSEKYSGIRILVSGICPHPALKEKLQALLTDKIEYRDGFFSMEDIAEMAAKSEFVLFTYNSESVLSSGSLMDSIRMGSRVIGPEKGAFRDLSNCSFIETYRNFEEIPVIIKREKQEKKDISGEIEAFCTENSWQNFADKLFTNSKGIL